MRCSICHTVIQEGEPTRDCPECRQVYHQTCWEDLGGCATYACREAVPPEKPPPPQQTGAGWGDKKECPRCRRSIGSSLLICQCGARFPYADPMTRKQYRAWLKRQDEQRGNRKALVLLFIFSLFGIPAPLLGLIAGILAYRNRHQLAGQDGTYLAMGYGTAALGATYTVMILLLCLGL